MNGVLWVFEDVTQHYQYEQNLKLLNEELALKTREAEESNLRYRYVSKATFDAIWDWDLTHNSLFWGENYQSIFGYDQASNKPHIDAWQEAIHPEDASRVIKSITEAAEGLVSNWADEYRYRKADGAYAHVTDRAWIVRDVNGKATRMVGALRDVTAHKLAQIKIKESEFNLRAIFESSIESFVLLDATYHVKAFNSRAKKYLNRFLGQTLKTGDSLLCYLQPHRRETFGRYLRQVSEGEVVEYDRAFDSGDGSKYWSHLTLTPVYHESTVIGVCITERDISERQNHLNTIEKQNKAFTDISWTQSHLVRAPLTNIMSITNMLKNNPSEEDMGALLNYLEDATEKLDQVIRKITALTHLEKQG
nr:PAS domain S-box protein [Mucilaginibacter sp. Bleaf8]